MKCPANDGHCRRDGARVALVISAAMMLHPKCHKTAIILTAKNHDAECLPALHSAQK